MNKHDQSRKDALLKTLIKAKELAGTAALYLSVHNQDMNDIFAVNDALEHIDIALERLGAAVVTT